MLDAVEIVPLEPRDGSRAAMALSLAMLDNPIHLAMLKSHGESARQKLEDMFTGALTDNPGEIFAVRHESGIIAVIRSYSCSGCPPSVDPCSPQERIDEAELADIDARLSLWRQVWDFHDPPQPHRHLGPIGVLPQFQGRGIGTSLMQGFCQRVDAASQPAYLETDKAENVRFYRKFGFEITGETLLFGVRNTFMWRHAQN